MLLTHRSQKSKMNLSSNSPARVSLGFLLIGILGVFVGAMIVAWTTGKIFTQTSKFPALQAASAAIGKQANETDFERRVIDAAKSAEPSVVLIKSTVHGQQINPFYDFFGPQSGPQVQPFTAQASGSGFIVKRSGNTAIIATNAHVIYGADNIQVVLSNR